MSYILLIIIILLYVIPIINALCLSGMIIQKHIESDRAIVLSEFLKGMILTLLPIINWVQVIKLYNILSKLLKKHYK